MDRRAFLFSTAWLAVAPTPDLTQDGGGSGGYAPTSSGQDTVFGAWRAAFIEKAVAQGLPRDRVIRALTGVIPDPDVIAQDQHQPEFSKPISAYINGTVSPSRVALAQAKMASVRPWLGPIAERYQVPGPVLVSVWGIESSFGQIQGNDDVIRSMATLASEGRRRDFAEEELIAALRIIFSGEASRSQLVGSWAGAMGQTQFTPQDYLTYAVDGDGDGKRDIWNSTPDALASTANFLSKKGHWQPGQSAQVEVAVHTQGFDYTLVEGPAKTLYDWASAGVRPVDPSALRDGDRNVGATLIMPMGWQGPSFLTFPNHMAIRAYNNATHYALAVGLLADRITGRGQIVQPWPADQATSLADRKAAQDQLKRLGFYIGETDGRIGTGSRKAVRLWQASQNLPADGYLSYVLMQRLIAQAAPTA